jgi:predicted transcriptional regulator
MVKGKSDIIVSFDEEYLAPVISQKKTYDFRSWRADPEVKRMWVYANKPLQSLMYILEVDKPIEYPKQIPNDNTYNEMFNQGKNVKWKFAYRIKHLWKLNEPIGMKELKADYGIHPPQQFTYVSKYPQLVKYVEISKQIKILIYE